MEVVTSVLDRMYSMHLGNYEEASYICIPIMWLLVIGHGYVPERGLEGISACFRFLGRLGLLIEGRLLEPCTYVRAMEATE